MSEHLPVQAGTASASAFEALTTQSVLGGGSLHAPGCACRRPEMVHSVQGGGDTAVRQGWHPAADDAAPGGSCHSLGLGVASSQEDVSSWAAGQEVGRATPLSTSLPEVQSQASRAGHQGPRLSPRRGAAWDRGSPREAARH